MFMFYLCSIYSLFVFWLDFIFIICVSCVTLCYFEMLNTTSSIMLFDYFSIVRTYDKWVLYFTVFVYLYKHDIPYLYWSFILYTLQYHASVWQKKHNNQHQNHFPRTTIPEMSQETPERRFPDRLGTWQEKLSAMLRHPKGGIKGILAGHAPEQGRTRTSREKKGTAPNSKWRRCLGASQVRRSFYVAFFFWQESLVTSLIHEGWKGFFPSDSGTSQFLGCCKFTLE